MDRTIHDMKPCTGPEWAGSYLPCPSDVCHFQCTGDVLLFHNKLYTGLSNIEYAYLEGTNSKLSGAYIAFQRCNDTVMLILHSRS
jgi:hypothetical protein